MPVYQDEKDNGTWKVYDRSTPTGRARFKPNCKTRLCRQNERLMRGNREQQHKVRKPIWICHLRAFVEIYTAEMTAATYQRKALGRPKSTLCSTKILPYFTVTAKSATFTTKDVRAWQNEMLKATDKQGTSPIHPVYLKTLAQSAYQPSLTTQSGFTD